jgi:hypothetical protein
VGFGDCIPGLRHSDPALVPNTAILQMRSPLGCSRCRTLPYAVSMATERKSWNGKGEALHLSPTSTGMLKAEGRPSNVSWQQDQLFPGLCHERFRLPSGRCSYRFRYGEVFPLGEGSLLPILFYPAPSRYTCDRSHYLQTQPHSGASIFTGSDTPQFLSTVINSS